VLSETRLPLALLETVRRPSISTRVRLSPRLRSWIELPALSSTLNDATVTGNVQNSGLSSIQLRNLGDNRTLVLIDGRRTVSNSANGNRVSLNTIPSNFVDRVEIITGGTSSIYGSDAVAGVVNIITENDVGAELRARIGLTEEGDGKELNLQASWGARFAGDRGYVFVAGEYEDEDGILARDREFAIRQVDFDYNTTLGINEFDTLYLANGVPTSGDQPASTFPPNVPRDLSSFTTGGVFYGASGARDRFFVGQTLVPIGPDVQTGRTVPIGTSDNGNIGYFLPNRDGYDLRSQRSLILPRERYLAAAKASFEFSPAAELFGQIQYARIDSIEIREPTGIGSSDTFPVVDPATGLSTEITFGRIPCRRASGSGSGPCNPFVPDEIRRDVSTSGSGVFFSRRFAEIGNQITDNERKTIRGWLGLRGEFGGGWSYEASAGYGEFNQLQFRRNEINGRNLQLALDAELGPDGQPRCRNAAARAAGCVPVNLFGEGSITPAAADYLRVDLRQDVTVEQYTAQAFASGTLFELPAGPVGLAFGADYRRDEQSLSGDILSQLGGTTGNPVPNFGGSITAVEGFAEVSVPLLSEQPFAHLLALDASARVAHYDIEAVGTVFSYRAGVQWAPIPDIRFRAQYARAQRAPDLTELFSPPRGDFDSATDICNGVTPTSTGRIAQNCLSDPGIQAALAQLIADGEDPVFDQVGSSIYSPNSGNPNLNEETADTVTLGVVVQPRFIPGLSIAVDYYSIDIADAITSFNNEDILAQCYDNDAPLSENPFCAEITRNPNTGQLAEVIQREFNLAGFNVEGIDVAVQYTTPLEGIGLPGRLDLRYDATHQLKRDFLFNGLTGLELDDQLGELTNGSFDYRARGSVAYRDGPLRIRWTVQYFSEILDSRERLEAYRELLQTLPNAEFPLFLEIPEVWEHDLFLSFDVPFNDDASEFRFFFGINNVFNEVSPFLPTGTDSGRNANYNSAYDVAGRRFYTGVRLEF